MKFNFILLFSLISVQVYAQSQLEVQSMIEENSRQAYELLSKGMTEPEKQKLKESLEQQKQVQLELVRKSPDELKKISDDGLQKMNSPEERQKIKNRLQGMSPEERALLKKIIKNANELQN